MINKGEFEVLTVLEKKEPFYSVRKIASILSCSVGKVQGVLRTLNEKGYVNGYKITEKGLSELEPYKVKRGIILAAGKGSRLYPLTLTTPKPLIKVNGKMIIETIIEALLNVGITEIIIVVGYLKEKFSLLKEKYPFLQFVENQEYDSANNISSAMKVKDKFSSSYILDADLIINGKDVITKYQWASNYIGIKVARTDDWCLIEKNGIVKGMKRGGENVYLMRDVVYFSKNEGEKFKDDCEKVYFSSGGQERYYDEVALDVYKNSYKFIVRPIDINDVVEIDSLSDLKAIDKSYNGVI